MLHVVKHVFGQPGILAGFLLNHRRKVQSFVSIEHVKCYPQLVLT